MPGRSILTWKLPHIPVPPALMGTSLSYAPLASRTRPEITPSKPVPMPQTPTGSSTMSCGRGWRTLIGGKPAIPLNPLAHQDATTAIFSHTDESSTILFLEVAGAAWFSGVGVRRWAANLVNGASVEFWAPGDGNRNGDAAIPAPPLFVVAILRRRSPPPVQEY